MPHAHIIYDDGCLLSLQWRHMSTMRLKSPSIQLFVQQFARIGNKGNTNASP